MSESNEWRVGVLEDIANINPSVSISGLSNETGVSFLSMPDVGENGRITNHQCRPLHEVKSGFTRFEENDVLFAKITPCMQNGKGAFATGLHSGIGFGSTEFHVLRANEDGDAEFIYHVSLSPELRTKAIAFFSGSAGQQRVSKDFFGRYSLDIPPPKEQRKIARILTTLDNLIEKTEALIAKYQSIKQGMMHDLFTRGVDSSGQLRPTHEQAPDLYNQSELGWIPKDCTVSTLGDVSERVVVGLALSVTHAYRENGIPLIRNQNIRRGFFEDDEMLYLDPKFAALFPNKAVRKDDVLTVRTGSNVGDTACVPDEYVGSPTFTTLMTSTDKSVLHPQYLVHYIVSIYGVSELYRLLVGGGKENLNVGEFVKLRIILHPLEVQNHLVESVESIDKKIQSEQTLLSKHKVTKSGLMQDLLTGKVRVKVDEVEEACAHA